MSTNNNNAAQTLFRFVSLRNPQLTETKAVNLGFIQRSTGLEGVFDTDVQNENATSVREKLRVLGTTASNFESEAFTTAKDVELLHPVLFKIAVKISRGKVLIPEEEQVCETAYEDFSTTETAKLRKLWNNLLYQVVTQNDFYIKEAIIQMLKALHFGYALSLTPTSELTEINGEDYKKRALNAKVVLPASLFSDEEADSGSQGVMKISQGAVEQMKMEGRNEQKKTQTVLEKEQLEALKDKLQDVQTAYAKSYRREYNEAYQAYLDENGEAIATTEELWKIIDAQITEEMSEEEKESIYRNYEFPEIAPFEFSFRDELNLTDLKNTLSKEHFTLFLEHFAGFEGEPQENFILDYERMEILEDRLLKSDETFIKIKDDFETFQDVYEKLDSGISEVTQKLLTFPAPANQKLLAGVGGVLIPVTTPPSTPGMYYLKRVTGEMQFSDFSYLKFYYNTDTLSLSSAKITAVSGQGPVREEYVSTMGITDNKIVFEPALQAFPGQIVSLKIDLYFQNGQQGSVNLTNIINNKDYVGMLNMKPRSEVIEGSYPYDPENPDETFDTPPESNPSQGLPGSGAYVPKRFGVKRLGIADYLKVVQSVHAYVPGEVSNIENVMASELRHKSSTSRDYSETTDTDFESQETEKMSDTTKVNRNELQTEIARELDRQQSITANTNFSYGSQLSGIKFDIGTGYANNTAQHDSTKQAVAKSQEITERAMERVLTKVSRERILKIIKEYTEKNVHEFDNRGKVTETDNPEAAQPKHITGVYRWVDKKMKNQIYNYGKRTMFEFMIPEPARLHRLATAVSKVQTLTPPVDPRKADEWKMPNANAATDAHLQYWADYYGVKLTEKLKSTKTVQNMFYFGREDDASRTQMVDVPDNYVCTSFVFNYSYDESRKKGKAYLNNSILGYHILTNHSDQLHFYNKNLTGQFPIDYRMYYLNSFTFEVIQTCKLSDAYLLQWKTENFNAIILAYEAAYQKFLDDQKKLDDEQREKEAEAKEKVSNFYRYMEADTLKHNCIAYLLQDYLNILGRDFTAGDTMEDFSVVLDDRLDQYAALAKFMEQAFEWEIMDYTFYPYYWADRKKWQEMYISESVDPLFRSFLQAGMARVVVTVKPGFEDAVQFFMSTGKIWNGGEVPVIADPLYMSIVDELRQPTGKPQGKYWITRVPTTLTILQAGSAGLEVTEALPIFPEDHPENCENPIELETESAFGEPEDVVMQNLPGETSTLD